MSHYEVLGPVRTVGHPAIWMMPPEEVCAYAVVEADSANEAKWKAHREEREFADHRSEVGWEVHPLTGLSARRLPPCLLRCDGGCAECGEGET